MTRFTAWPATLASVLSVALAPTANAQPTPDRARADEPRPPEPGELTVADLKAEIDAILRSGAAETIRPEVSAPRRVLQPKVVKIDRNPPKGASAYVGAREADVTLVRAPPRRVARDAPKAAAETGRPLPAPRDWRTLNFAGQKPYEVPRGLDEALLSPGEAARGRGRTYAFLILNERPSPATTRELQALGLQILGRHAGALKVTAPLDRERLKRIADLPYVEWLGYAPPELKIDPNLRLVARKYANDLPGLPVTITAFDETAARELRAQLGRGRAKVGATNARLGSISAVVPAEDLERLAALDGVLFLELNRPGGIGHDNSMAVMSADYIRPGGAGTRFNGAPIRVGILDTGFMVGGAAATTHQDLNKFGCGRNFTSDAAGVWNDQNGHGTHVLATTSGTGTAQARNRGVAPGVGGSAATRIRGAKIWNSAGSGTQADEIEGEDYMETASDCGAERPQLVNVSGGASGANQVGTDSRSRNVDQIVWDRRQTWVVCSGNSGPGAGTIWSAGVAKNVLTVGNVQDTGDGTIGDIANTSSRGPAGDGRMKPTVVATGRTITSADAGTTNGYDDKSGCSMATPHVTGVAATLMQHYPEFRTLPHLTRAHLMATALLHDDVIAPVNNSPAPDTTRNTFGLGRVTPYTAHWAHLNAAGWSTHWAWRTITDRQWGFRDIEVPRGARRLVVAMTWDEPAASAGAAAAVDFDLDLWIDRAPFCTPDSVGQCGEWASQSWIDNVEYQIIENPQPGTYRLKFINWDAPSSGVPAAISATIVRGDTTPAMGLTVTGPAGPAAPRVGQTVTVTTTVANPSWILSGVHLAATSIPAGVTVTEVRTTREDNVVMDFTTARAMSLGDIVQGDTRTATWRIRLDTAGSKTLRFKAWSENGGTQERSITFNPIGPVG